MNKSEVLEKDLAFSLETICKSDNYLKNLFDIIESHPNESAVKFGKAIIYFILDDFNGTLAQLTSLSESFPNIPLLHRRIAEIYIHKNIFPKAAIHLEKAIELDKQDLTSKVWLSLIYFKVGKVNEANAVLNELKDLIFILNATEKSFGKMN